MELMWKLKPKIGPIKLKIFRQSLISEEISTDKSEPNQNMRGQPNGK